MLAWILLGYFTNRPDHIWDTEVECPACEGSNWQIIEIKYSSGYLRFNINCQNWTEHPLKVNPNSIFYSLDARDVSQYSMEIPFELDVLESIIGNDSYANYIASITEIKDLLKVPEIQREKVLLKLFFSNTISIFETYLFDLIINAVNSDERTLRKVVQEYKLFEKEKIEKTDIFNTLDTIKADTIRKLQSLLYHNLSVIIPLFKDGLQIDFSHLIRELPEAIAVRHDIVHRNGRDFGGNEHSITIQKVTSLLTSTQEVVDFINHEFETKGIKIQKEQLKKNGRDTDDLPF
jgi:hypothetical protein